MTNNFLSVKTAAPTLGMSEITLRRFIHTGRIGYKRIGKKYLFTPEQIQDYLKNVDVPITAGGKNGNPA